MDPARDSAAQVLHPVDQNGNLGVIMHQGSSPGLDSMEPLTSVNINVTDGSVICPSTVLAEADNNHSLLDLCEEQDSP